MNLSHLRYQHCTERISFLQLSALLALWNSTIALGETMGSIALTTGRFRIQAVTVTLPELRRLHREMKGSLQKLTDRHRGLVWSDSDGAFEPQQFSIPCVPCDNFIRTPFREADIFETMSKHIGVSNVYQESAPTPKPMLMENQARTRTIFAALSDRALPALQNATAASDSQLISNCNEPLAVKSVQFS